MPKPLRTIHLFVLNPSKDQWIYTYSTQRSKTLKEAKEKLSKTLDIPLLHIKATFDSNKK